MGMITKKDLSIFRGTCSECFAQPTEDMRIYLAWDTQEIYVGNAFGEKILYGVSKSLYRRIDQKFVELEEQIGEKIDAHIKGNIENLVAETLEEIRKELFSEVSNEVSKQINSRITGISEEITKNRLSIEAITAAVNDNKNEIQEHLDEAEKNISNLEESIKKSEEELRKELSLLTGDNSDTYKNLESKINAVDKKISSTAEDINSTIKSEIEDVESKITAVNTKITNVGTDLNSVRSNVNSNTDRLNALDGVLNTRLTDLKTELNKDIKANKASIDELDERVTSARVDINSMNKRLTNVEATIANGGIAPDPEGGSSSLMSGTSILYLTKKQMQTPNDYIIPYIPKNTIVVEENGEKKEIELNKFGYVTIFCTEEDTTAPPNYKQGQLYYYVNGSISPLAGSGTIEKTEVKATLSALSITGWPTGGEITNKKVTINSGAITASISGKTEAVSTVTLKYNNSEITRTYVSGVVKSSEAIVIDCSKAGTHTVSLDVKVKDDTTDYDYVCTPTSRSQSVSFYQPWLIKVNSDIVRRGTSGTMGAGKYTISCKKGDEIYFLVNTTQTINQFTMGGFPILAENYSTGTIDEEINDINVTYRYYKFPISGNVTSVEIAF